MTIGDAVKQACDESGLPRYEIARRVGVSQRSLEHWTHGRREPRLRYLSALSEATGKPLRYFLDVDLPELYAPGDEP